LQYSPPSEVMSRIRNLRKIHSLLTFAPRRLAAPDLPRRYVPFFFFQIGALSLSASLRRVTFPELVLARRFIVFPGQHVGVPIPVVPPF